jgi:hypothetical protein
MNPRAGIHWHVSISHIETRATASAIGLRGDTIHA